MSSENDETATNLQRTLQPSAPNAPHGTTDGLQARPETATSDALPPSSDAPLRQPDALTAPPVPPSVQAHLTGEPNAWTVTQWCKKCQADVLPVGKGECPRCHVALRLNFKARRHPVNVLRRDAELAKLTARYRPDTTMVQSTCEMLAGILEQVAALKPGSTEHDRLVKLSQQLFETLETSLASRESHTSSSMPGLENVPTSALMMASDLMQRVADGEVLSEREQGRLDVLHAAMDGTVSLPPDREDVPEFQPYRSESSAAIVAPASTSRPVAAPEQPAPEPTCGYGCGSLTKCAEIKATRLDTWRVLHSLDPEVIRARDEEATEVMKRMVGQPLPDWCR